MSYDANTMARAAYDGKDWPLLALVILSDPISKTMPKPLVARLGRIGITGKTEPGDVALVRSAYDEWSALNA